MTKIQLAHGSGGKLSYELINSVFKKAFSNEALDVLHDGAQLPKEEGRIAFSTDGFVVKPRFFPGGSIGTLAVCGTVNDVAMNGAKVKYLSASFIIEEGFPLAELEAIVKDMQEAAATAKVQIVTGDTKVVEKGSVDGVYITTAGIGFIPEGINIGSHNIKAGQDIILSGSLADHSVAIMGKRHGLSYPESIKSDCAPLNKMVEEILAAVPKVVFLRDVTRGGLATTLNEVAIDAKMGIMIDEECLIVKPEVQAVCDILGFDPLYMANEGKIILITPSEYTTKVLEVMHNNEYGQDARVIGQTVEEHQGQVGLKTAIGGIRLVDMLVGDQLPRIC